MPVVIVGTVLNRTSEHIDSVVFTSDLERELINSGKVKSSLQKTRGRNLEKRNRSAGVSSKQTVKPQKEETGADLWSRGL